MRSAVLFGVAVLSVLTLSNADAQSVKYYRRSVPTRSPYPTYADEVPARSRGTYYRVERDVAGRVTHLTTLRNGHPTGEWIYDFDRDSKLPKGFRYLEASETKGVTKFIRNLNGDVVRSDEFTAAGSPTGYWTADYSGDTVVTISNFTSDGRKTSWSVSSYSPAGLLTQIVSYLNPDDSTRYIVSEIDRDTGHQLSVTQMAGGEVQNKQRYSYNADGDIIRHDGYKADGSWLASDEYSDDLRTKRVYAAGQEFRYSYDGTRTMTETQVWVRGHLVCRLTYDRMSDFTVKRTIAVGPNGELWAEYADQFVTDVGRDGTSISKKPATIYKKGSWW